MAHPLLSLGGAGRMPDYESRKNAMEAISNTESKQTVTQPTPASEAPAESTETSEFETFLRSNLTPDPANEISEEDLFAALVQERIKKTKGDETLALFKE